MGYFQVRYNSRVVNYEHRGFIRLATSDLTTKTIRDGRWAEFNTSSQFSLSSGASCVCRYMVRHFLWWTIGELNSDRQAGRANKQSI